MIPDSNPELLIFEHVESCGVSPSRLLERGRAALPLCLAQPGEGSGKLVDLGSIEVNLVSDETIAQVHGEFMNDPTPTDVITFHHGEIFVSLDTAQREAVRFGHSTEREALLYLIHGLLHLNGHGDKSPVEHEAMKKMQERILDEVWEGETEG
jgi:probable rRNA maturation factor